MFFQKKMKKYLKNLEDIKHCHIFAVYYFTITLIWV